VREVVVSIDACVSPPSAPSPRSKRREVNWRAPHITGCLGGSRRWCTRKFRKGVRRCGGRWAMGLLQVCNALQRTATHCNALQRTATHCNALQRTATHHNALQRTTTHCAATHCNAPQRSVLEHTAIHCTTLQHTRGLRQVC